LRYFVQGGHSPGKPRKVREFQSGQGKVRENGKSQGNVRETSIILDFEQAEESFWQLVGLDFGYVHH